MKAKRKILFLILFMCLGNLSIAQNKNVTITKGVDSYYIGGKCVKNITYVIYNNTKDFAWVWFSKNDSSKQSDSLKIREYFRIRPRKADASFYELMADGNVGSFTNDLFSYFVKVIPPRDTFAIQIIATNIDEFEIMSAVSSHLNIVPQAKMSKWLKIEYNDLVKQFSFKSSFIAIPWSLFKPNLVTAALP